MCVCLSVSPAFTAYVSLTTGRIFIKLGENFNALCRSGFALRAKRAMAQGGKKKFFFAFLCVSHVSEHFQSIETHFFFQSKRSEQDASAIVLRQTVTVATAIFLSFMIVINHHNIL